MAQTSVPILLCCYNNLTITEMRKTMCGFLGCGWMDMGLDKCHLGFAVSMLRKDRQCVDNLARACLLQMAPFQIYQFLREKGLLGQAAVKNGETHSKRTPKIKTQKAEKKFEKKTGNLQFKGCGGSHRVSQLSQAIPQLHVERMSNECMPIARCESRHNERRVCKNSFLCF